MIGKNLYVSRRSKTEIRTYEGGTFAQLVITNGKPYIITQIFLHRIKKYQINEKDNLPIFAF